MKRMDRAKLWGGRIRRTRLGFELNQMEYGWRLVLRGITRRPHSLLQCIHLPYNDVPRAVGKHWIPFRLDYWSMNIFVLEHNVYCWRRYANRYGRAVRGNQ